MVWKMDSKNIHLANFLIDINSQIVASKEANHFFQNSIVDIQKVRSLSQDN
jgi:hypothetical protein